MKFDPDDPPDSTHAAMRKLIHDLRSPLTSLQLGLETLRDISDDAETTQTLDMLLGEVLRLSDILETTSLKHKRREPVEP